MIRHCVWVKFKPGVGMEERASIYADLQALVGRIDGLERATFGTNVSPEGLGQGFADGFAMDFVDARARDAYLVDPDHQAAGARLVGAAVDGLQGILVFDIEV